MRFSRFRRWGIPFLLLCATTASAAPLNRDLKPDENDSPDVAPVLRDMGVVQRKAMDKANKLLFNNYWSMDFSDGPFTNYAVNFDLGYGISDFWEIYFHTAPVYIHDQRSIVNTVESLTLANGQKATLTGSKASLELGGDLIWAPFYGKDSFGLRNIIRSDTFLKFGANHIQYDNGSGLRFELGVGKTFFIGKHAGIRAVISDNYTQTIVNQEKSFKWIVMIEAGYVLYLF